MIKQYWFDPLDYDRPEEARQARDRHYRDLKAKGFRATRNILRNQLRPYAGLGIPDGRVRDVYFINSWEG